MPRQLWLADIARQAGLVVAEVDGWRERGSTSFNPNGIVCHHTGGAATGDMPSLRVLINGRSDLPGPLCAYGLGRSGKVYVVAAGRANHAGSGGWQGLVGNSSVIGIEAENTGGQQWPLVQLNAYVTLCAAITKRLSGSPRFTCGHKEWAPGRKVDPYSINMTSFRTAIANKLQTPTPIPTPEEDMSYRYSFQGGMYTTNLVHRQHWESGGPGFAIMQNATKDLGEVPQDFHESLVPAT